MKKILVPVDFSGHTSMTVSYALELAGHTGAEIRFFHTYFDQIILADSGFPDTLDMSTVYNEELMKEIFRMAGQNMQELVTRTEGLVAEKKLPHITITSTLVGGEIEHELKVICKEYHPDLVVMGTRGKGNNLNVWGKVSTYIIDHARVPVFTIPRIESFRGFGNILFTADLSEKNSQALARLATMFRQYPSVIHVVHFYSPARKRDENLKMEKLRSTFEQEEQAGRIQFSLIGVEEEHNQQAVDQIVHDRKIDLIAFQPHKRSLFYMMFTRKITKKNLFATNIPLLALPATD